MMAKFFTPTVLKVSLFLSPIPFLFSLCHFVLTMQKLDGIEEEMERVRLKASHVAEVQKKENSLLSALTNPDPNYFDKHLETLTFLLPEFKKMEALHLENPDEDKASDRLQFLKNNRLIFSEGQIRTCDSFREVEEYQQRSIEIDEEDLKKILCLIEGITIWPYGPREGRPQLIFKDFTLTKKEYPSQEKVFVVSMQLLKREKL